MAVAVAAGVLPPVALPAPAAAAIGAVSTWKMKWVVLPVNDAAYDRHRDVLLVIAQSGNPNLGNDLVELDPETGAVGRHVHVGSKAGSIAITEDGAYAYVGLWGANRIVRVSLQHVHRDPELLSTVRVARRPALRPHRPGHAWA